MFIKILKKIAGILIILIGIYFMVSSLKMIFVDTPKTKAALKEAVYVGESAIDPANDGKIVILFRQSNPILHSGFYDSLHPQSDSSVH